MKTTENPKKYFEVQVIRQVEQTHIYEVAAKNAREARKKMDRYLDGNFTDKDVEIVDVPDESVIKITSISVIEAEEN